MVNCSAPGTARWIDSRTWSYDFKKDLPAGLRCSFTLSAGLKTLRGATFAGRPQFTFDTGGPSIVESRPWADSSDIDEQQAFVLVLDAQADEQSILEHAQFAVGGIPQMVGATLMSGADRAELLKRFKNFINGRPAVIVQARQRFPDNAAIRLVWGAGIKTITGIATTQDQEFKYQTRKAFKAKFQCEREEAKGPCIPLSAMTLNFSWPVNVKLVQRVALVSADGKRRAPAGTNDLEFSSITFNGPFAESAQYKIEVPPDVGGHQRTAALANAAQYPLTVRTGPFPPLMKFSARFGIIEHADPVLPVTVRNIEAQLKGMEKLDLQGTPVSSGSKLSDLLSRVEARLWRVTPAPDPSAVLDWLRKVGQARRDASIFDPGADTDAKTFTIPKPNGPNAFEVMGIPLGEPGLYVVELSSAKLGSVLLGGSQRMYVPTLALVTDLAVHFKKGHDNSLVWVTSLEKARPIEGANVTIADCSGAVLWQGRTDRRGVALVPRMKEVDKPPECSKAADSGTHDQNPDYYTASNEALRELNRGLLISASYRNDFSFDRTSWQSGIESWRYHLPSDYPANQPVAHTVLDRPLFRAGETVHMKHFIRTKTIAGFGMLAAEKLPQRMELRLIGGDDTYGFDLKWSDHGAAESIWPIPKNAKLGEYSINLIYTKPVTQPTPAPDQSPPEDSTIELVSGGFRVEEFPHPVDEGGGPLARPLPRCASPVSRWTSAPLTFRAGRPRACRSRSAARS